MAGSTEQEQIKSNQLLEKVERSTTETAVAMNSLIEAVKQPSEYEKVAEGIADETKKIHETSGKHDKDRAKADDKFHKDFTSYAKDSTTSDKTQAVHNKFIQDTEKRKEGLAKMAFAFQQRAAKLATRGLDKSWDWTKGKVQGVTKAVGGFFENLMKLLALLGLWFALSWLKGKDLKALWDKFLKVIEDWKNILPEWIKNLTVPEFITTGLASLAAAWLLWKGSLKLAADGLSAVGNGLKRWFGIDAPFTKKLSEIDLKIAKLTKQKAALQRSIKYATSLDEASELSKKLKLTNEALDLAKAEKTAVTRAKTLAQALADEGDLAKKLKDANLELAKATKNEAAAQKAFNLGKDLAPDSPLAKKLAAASDELAKATKQASVAEEAARLARETARAAKKAAEVAQANARPPTIPPKPKPVWNMRAQRWTLPGRGFISEAEAVALGAPPRKPPPVKPPPKGVAGLKDLDLGGGFWSQIKASMGLSQEGNAFRELMEKMGTGLKNMAAGIPNAPVIKQFMSVLRHPATQAAFNFLNIADFTKGALSADADMNKVAAAEGSLMDSWTTQMVKAGEMLSGYIRGEEADFAWSNYLEKRASEMTGTITNRWMEQMKDEAGNLMWETDPTTGLPLLDAEGKQIPITAGIGDMRTSSKGMSGYDAIMKNFSSADLANKNPLAWMSFLMQTVGGTRFKTDPITKEVTAHETEGGLINETKQGIDDLVGLMKAYFMQQEKEMRLVAPVTNNHLGWSSLANDPHGLKDSN